MVIIPNFRDFLSIERVKKATKKARYDPLEKVVKRAR